MTDAISGEQVTYTYDSLKRLIKAETTQTGGLQWGQSFGYDDFGNLTTKTPTTGHTGTSMSLSIDQNTNHVTMSGFAYDANGNMTSIPSTPQNINLTYDTENRTGGTWYDQQNQPLDRTGAPGVWYLYALNGERMGTYTYSVSWTQYPNPNGTGYVYLATVTQTQVSRNIYFGGHLIQSNGTTVVLDRLGSVRANENGETFEYYPYGEEITIKNPQDREKFGMYTRESSTGLDYADQRYYSSVYGQFGRSDMGAGSTPQSPLTWNGYRYATGDPINAGDPTGMFGCGSALDGDDSDVAFNCFFARPGSVQFVYPIEYYTGCPGYGVAVSFLPDQGCAALIAAAADNSHPSLPSCSISLDTRSVAHTGGIGSHTYLDVTEATGSFVLEGGPTMPHNFIRHPKAPWGKLVGEDELVPAPGTPIPPNTYFLGATNPYKDLTLGSETGPGVCAEIMTLTHAIDDYNSTQGVPYALRPTGAQRNSNSFTYTLLYDIGLNAIFSPLISNSPGWGLIVPGLK